ncbi:hypothetical protein [Sphingomonas sp.]|uniref:hypothetical protein n=1 Tax=Sphingomonas sp. TaxID=28214 RepID=UPI0025FDEE96|nr:hypothetical protein [Sphingomonas sp.]
MKPSRKCVGHCGWTLSISGAAADHPVSYGEQVLKSVTHLLGDRLLLFEGSSRLLLPFAHEKGHADEHREICHSLSVPGIEMVFGVSYNPQGTKLVPVAYGEGHEQHLWKNKVLRCDPIVEPLRMRH